MFVFFRAVVPVLVFLRSVPFGRASIVARISRPTASICCSPPFCCLSMIRCTVLSHLDVRTLTETIPMVSRYFYHLSVGRTFMVAGGSGWSAESFVHAPPLPPSPTPFCQPLCRTTRPNLFLNESDDFLWRLICERDCGVTVQATHPVYYDQTLSWKETLWASYCPHFLATPWDVLEEHFSEQVCGCLR